MTRNKNFFVILFILMISCSSSFASEISLNDNEILLNGEVLANGNVEGIVYSKITNNGSNDENGKKENIEIENIITITKSGEYIFTGSLSDGQIAIDANEIIGDVKIILNNVNITCDNAPAIFIYSKDIKNDNCKVTISSKKESTNIISGGKIKSDVQGWTDQNAVLYYIEKSYDDNNKYYERYKYDGAISSDISLTFDGEGILKVVSKKKEGIESKMNITINGGTLLINSVDDAINAAADNESIITINDGFIVAYLDEEAEEGDGIDSNGSIEINGGVIYCFACPGSDSGLDADNGTYINGGTVFSIGTMNDVVTFANEINGVKATFNPNLVLGDIVCVADEEGKVIFAYKADREIGNIVYTSSELEKNKKYKVYSNAKIDGVTDEWGIFTNISSSDLNNAKENTFNEMQRPNFIVEKNLKENKYKVIWASLSLTFSVVLFIILLLIDINDKNSNPKLKIINLIFGILIGIFLAFGIINLVENDITIPQEDRRQMKIENVDMKQPIKNMK